MTAVIVVVNDTADSSITYYWTAVDLLGAIW